MDLLKLRQGCKRGGSADTTKVEQWRQDYEVDLLTRKKWRQNYKIAHSQCDCYSYLACEDSFYNN